MLRELTLSTLAALMLTSTAFAVVDKEVAGKDKEKAKIEGAKISDKEAEQKKLNISTRAKSIADDLEKAALADATCDAGCKASATALRKVVNAKGDLGLGDTMKPEETLRRIQLKMTREGKSFSVAKKEVFESLGVKEKELIDCAGAAKNI